MDIISPEYARLTLSLYCFATFWLTAALAVFGVLGLTAPARFRDLLNVLPQNRFRYPLGGITVVTGVFLTMLPCCFSPAPARIMGNAEVMWRILAGFLGIATVAKGMLWLVAPRFVRYVVTLHTAQSDAWHRLLGVLCLILAGIALLLLLESTHMPRSILTIYDQSYWY